METLYISKAQARRILLAHQHLLPPVSLAGLKGIMTYMRKVRCIQYDPLNIAGRNSELVLQARVRDFTPALLDKLLYTERRLIDGWDKMMSILPVEDWPYFERTREKAKVRLRTGERGRPVLPVMDKVLEAIEKRGPCSSKDLDFHETVDWAWAPAKLSRAALDSGYRCGDLIIHHRAGGRKYYDIASRCIPEEVFSAEDPNTADESFHEWYVLRRVGSTGMLWSKSGDAWLGTFGAKERNPAISRLLEQGRLVQLDIDGIGRPFFIRTEDLPAAREVLERVNSSEENQGGEIAGARASIIAPLDNLIWDRVMTEALFGFTYRWEVYKPAAEREYGYYVLPLLYNDRFIARFEPGRDKAGGALLIKNWWWEPGVRQTAAMRAALGDCFARYKTFLGAERIRFGKDIGRGLAWLRKAANEAEK